MLKTKEFFTFDNFIHYKGLDKIMVFSKVKLGQFENDCLVQQQKKSS